MALERIILNIIPAGDMPVFHCSQYENGRPVIIDLVSSDDDAYLVGEGVTVELHCRKCDDTIVTMEPDEVDNNTVTFVTSEQLTACPGDNLCEVVLYSDTDPVQTLATLNFILHVEPDPLAGGLTSESEIYNLTQQIETIAQEVIGEDYYNKTEVDDLISSVQSQIPTKTSDLTNDSGFITSSDLTPYAKTADLATVATTGNYNDLLNKPDIDAMIAAALLAVMPVGTETGPIATFDTEISAPLVNVSCDIVATGGNGTPDNPNPINGYTEANITRCGVNLFMPDFSKWSSAGPYLKMSQITPEGISLLMSFKNKDTSVDISGCYFGFVDTNYESGTATDLRWCIQNGVVTNVTNNTSVNHPDIICNSLLLYPANETTFNKIMSRYDIQIELGNAASEYHPYNGNTYTIAFGQTVYGGVLDVTRGKLHVTWAKDIINDMPLSTGSFGGVDYFVYDQTLKKINNFNIKSDCFIVSSQAGVTNMPDNSIVAGTSNTYIYIRADAYATVSALKTALGSNCIIYELATPFDIDLTPEVISAVVGMNNVYSDTNGDTTVQYKDSIQHYIDTRV